MTVEEVLIIVAGFGVGWLVGELVFRWGRRRPPAIRTRNWWEKDE